MTYLNNAATSVSKPPALITAGPASQEMASAKVAKLLGSKGPVVFTKGGRPALKWAITSLIKPGDHIVSTDMEYGPVLEVLESLEKQGCTVTYVPVDKYGVLRYDLLEEAITDRTSAIVCCHGSNVTGNIVDMEKVSLMARRNNLKLIADGCQVVGATAVNLEELSVDAYCFTGHKKLMGPYETGGVCLKAGLDIDISTAPEAPDEEALGKLCAAIDFIEAKGIYGVAMVPHRLAKRFFEAVRSMDKVKVYGDFGTNERIPTVSIRVEGFSPKEVKEHMQKNRIAVASGDFKASRLVQSLTGDSEGLVRFSFGYFNTRIEVNDAIWALMKLLDLDDLYLLA